MSGTGDDGAGGTPAEPGVLSNHGASVPRGTERVARSTLAQGRYGRMFRHLPAFEPEDDVLWALADSMGPFPERPGPPLPPAPAGSATAGAPSSASAPTSTNLTTNLPTRSPCPRPGRSSA